MSRMKPAEFNAAFAKRGVNRHICLENERRISLLGGVVQITTNGNDCAYYLNGHRLQMTGDLDNIVKMMFATVNDFRDGKVDKKAVLKMMYKLKRVRRKSDVYKPGERFIYTEVIWEATVDNGFPIVGPLEMEEKEIFSRHRRVMELDPKKVKVYSLEGQKRSPQTVFQVTKMIRDCLGEDWDLVGNHNEKYLFARMGYFFKILPRYLHPDAWNALKWDMDNEHPLQKSNIMNLVALGFIRDGNMFKSDDVIDLRDYPVFYEDDDHNGLEKCDGLTVVFRFEDWKRWCDAKGQPMNYQDQIFACSWLQKGCFGLEDQTRPAGIYLNGSKLIDPRTGKKLAPTEIRLDDIMLVDSTSIVRNKHTVNISRQLYSYVNDEEWRNWYDDKSVALAKGIVDGSAETGIRMVDVLAPMGETGQKLLLDSGQRKVMTDSRGYAARANALLGDVYRTDMFGEIIQNNGSRLRGVLRGLPVIGRYVMVRTSDVPSYGTVGVPHGVWMTKQLADTLDWGVDDIGHQFRYPTLPHPGVGQRIVLEGIISEESIWNNLDENRRKAFLAKYPDFHWKNPDCFWLGEALVINIDTMALNDGDEDGDCMIVTREIHLDYENDNRTFEPPMIVTPEECAVDKMDTGQDYDWRNPEDRHVQCSMSQGVQISDTFARRLMDVLRGHHPNADQIENPLIKEYLAATGIKQKEIAFNLCILAGKIVRSQIYAKKRATNWEELMALLSIGPNTGAPFDTVRLFEQIVCSSNGIYEIVRDEAGHHHKQMVVRRIGDQVVDPMKLLEHLESMNYPEARVLRAITNALEDLWNIYAEDPIWHVHSGNADFRILEGSKINWNSTFNWNMRNSRVVNLACLHMPKKEPQEGISFEMESEISCMTFGMVDGKRRYKSRASNTIFDQTVMSQISRSIMTNRRTPIKFVNDVNGHMAGDEIRRFVVNGSEDTYMLSLWKGGKTEEVNRADIVLLDTVDDTNRINLLSERIKFWLVDEAERLADKYQVIIPEKWMDLFDEPKDYVHKVLECYILHHLSKTTALPIEKFTNFPSYYRFTFNWWTYAINIVGEDTLYDLLADPGESVLDQRKHLLPSMSDQARRAMIEEVKNRMG